MAKTGSISDVVFAPGTRITDHRDDRGSALVIPPDEIAKLRAQPRFFEAQQTAGLQIIADHSANRLLNAVVSDRGRFMIVMFAQYLHHVAIPGEIDAGLTASRLRRLCAETGFASPGRATAILNLMRFAGYLRPASANRDRRQRILVLTERLVVLQRGRWSRHLAALSLVMLEGHDGLQFLGEPWFEAGLMRNMIEQFIGGFRFTDFVPELTGYLDRNGALIIFVQLAMTAGGHETTAVPLTISGLASQFGVARGQVRNILDDAERDGLIRRTSDPRAPIIALPRLDDIIARFFAGSFLYTAHCVRLAIADRPASCAASTEHHDLG